MERRLIAIDGECVLCNRFAQFVVRHDPQGAFLFTGGADAGSVVLHEGGRRYTRSAAVLRIASILPGWIAVLARIASLIPERLRDAIYDFIARHRHRIFRARAVCERNKELQMRWIDEAEP